MSPDSGSRSKGNESFSRLTPITCISSRARVSATYRPLSLLTLSRSCSRPYEGIELLVAPGKLPRQADQPELSVPAHHGVAEAAVFFPVQKRDDHGEPQSLGLMDGHGPDGIRAFRKLDVPFTAFFPAPGKSEKIPQAVGTAAFEVLDGLQEPGKRRLLVGLVLEHAKDRIDLACKIIERQIAGRAEEPCEEPVPGAGELLLKSLVQRAAVPVLQEELMQPTRLAARPPDLEGRP